MDYGKMTGPHGERCDDAASGLLREADTLERYAKAVRMALLAGYSADFINERVWGNVTGDDLQGSRRPYSEVYSDVADRLGTILNHGSVAAGY